MLELDVRLTKDGKVVVFHDSSLLRVTGHDMKVCDVDYPSIPNLRARVPIDTMPGKNLNHLIITIYNNRFVHYFETWFGFSDLQDNFSTTRIGQLKTDGFPCSEKSSWNFPTSLST